MRVHFKESVKDKVDNFIAFYGEAIEFIELTKEEYIEFLEQISITQRILIINPETGLRTYNNIRIKVLT